MNDPDFAMITCPRMSASFTKRTKPLALEILQVRERVVLSVIPNPADGKQLEFSRLSDLERADNDG